MRISSGYGRIIILVCIIVCWQTVGFSDALSDQVDRLFSQWDNPDSPGCALGVIKDGQLIYSRGYGMANLEHYIPITPQTNFYLASVSKQFTSMCIALLEEQGKLQLDDDIRTYLPELMEYEKPIQIRHLIHHISGLRDYTNLLTESGQNLVGHGQKEQMYDLITKTNQLLFPTGSQYKYSNTAYFLLGLIVEKASGMPFHEFAEQNIFNPLGMKNTAFHTDNRVLIPKRAHGYYVNDGRISLDAYAITYELAGAGGLYSNIEDLFLWDQNFYNNKLGNGGQSLIERMYTRGTLNDGEVLDYAFGLRHGEYRGLKYIRHDGSLGAFRTALVRFEEQKFSVILLCNFNLEKKPIDEIVDLYLEDSLQEKEE